MIPGPLSLEQAVEVFVQGYCFRRSFTHPYVADRLTDGIWALRDAPRTRGDYRSDEFVVFGVEAADALNIAQQHTRGRFRLSALRPIDDPTEPLRARYREIGCRLMSTEPFFVHRLENIGPLDSPVAIRRVATPDDSTLLAKATARKPLPPEALFGDAPPLRRYMALDKGTPIGWVESIRAGGAAWCANMFVEPAYRRRGIASALMRQMLADDRDSGSPANVLLASHSGAKLYVTLGYEQIGELLIYNPPKVKRSSIA